MSSDRLTYHYQISKLWGEEKLSRYKPGGYHPVHLGDLFKDGRYKIINKLGFGGFSTVWLARDLEQQRWVSLKIPTADSTRQSQELQTLRALQTDDAANHVVRLLDSFVHEGPNGSHQCLVLELLGPSVDYLLENDFNEPGERMERDTILRITKQLLEGLAFVHSAGYAQGDVSARNIAFTSSELVDCSEKFMVEVIGVPMTEVMNPIDGEPLKPGLPKYVVGSTIWNLWVYVDEEDIRLIDWGEAFCVGNEPTKIAQPLGLNAPETVFTSRIDHRIDLWRAGCIIYYLALSHRPFQAYGLEGVICKWINFTEDLPAEWRPKWEEIKRNTRNTVDKIQDDERPELPPLEEIFHESVHEPELQVLLPIIQGLLRFLPENRISATDALFLLEKSLEIPDETL